MQLLWSLGLVWGVDQAAEPVPTIRNVQHEGVQGVSDSSQATSTADFFESHRGYAA